MSLNKPQPHSYKAADFTVSMAMDDANKIQGPDRSNFSAIGQKYNSIKVNSVPIPEPDAPRVDMN